MQLCSGGHRLPQRKRPHVYPDFFDVIQTCLPGLRRTDKAPPRRNGNSRAPNRILFLAVYDHREKVFGIPRMIAHEKLPARPQRKCMSEKKKRSSEREGAAIVREIAIHRNGQPQIRTSGPLKFHAIFFQIPTEHGIDSLG